jgi:hypothetical protein
MFRRRPGHAEVDDGSARTRFAFRPGIDLVKERRPSGGVPIPAGEIQHCKGPVPLRREPGKWREFVCVADKYLTLADFFDAVTCARLTR